MPVQLRSPYAFPERQLLFGGPGSRKTTSVLEMARHVAPPGVFWIVDNDESYAYGRALETDFADIADRVHVIESPPDWLSMTTAVGEVTSRANRDNGDWVIIDSISPAWDFVQAYVTEQVTGTDIAHHLMGLRAASADLSEFSKAVMDTVPWSIVKKEYARLITVPVRQWQGNLVLTAEAKSLGKKEDDQTKEWFQQFGSKPAGEGRLAYITSTVIFLEKVKVAKDTVFKMSTIKDRNRASVERQAFENFAVEYLMEVAGWERIRKAAS